MGYSSFRIFRFVSPSLNIVKFIMFHRYFAVIDNSKGLQNKPIENKPTISNRTANPASALLTYDYSFEKDTIHYLS